MNATNRKLVRAWQLFLEDLSPIVDEEFERLLPDLVAAGYVDADDVVWRFTPQGVARAEQFVRRAEI